MSPAPGARKVASWFGDEVDEGVIAPNMCVTEPLPMFMGPNLGVCGGGIYLRQIRTAASSSGRASA